MRSIRNLASSLIFITYILFLHLAVCLDLVILSVAAQRELRADEALPKGLERWLGHDECGSHQHWIDFYQRFATAIEKYKSRELVSPELQKEISNIQTQYQNQVIKQGGILSSSQQQQKMAYEIDQVLLKDNRLNHDTGALGLLKNTTEIFIRQPEVAFGCGTAMAAAFGAMSKLYEELNMPVQALRFDYQMKGEEYIDKSPWPVVWKDTVEAALKYMDRVQSIAKQTLWRNSRIPLPPPQSPAPKKKILIVSVCEYNAEKTPLYTLSYWNKKRYADRHGYDLVVHDKGPLLKDPFRKLFQEPENHRPPAWSKIDAVLEGLRQGYDWVMWMDCDSYFMDQSLGIHDLVDFTLQKREEDEQGFSGRDQQIQATGESELFDGDQDKKEFQKLLEKWDSADGSQESFDALTRSEDSIDETNIGWDKWLYEPMVEKSDIQNPGQQQQRKRVRTELIVSEDGLMLNTGIFFVRSSTWAWKFFQKVRRFTFGPRAPITQHPWWEQTAMVYLLQLPFSSESNWSMAPAVALLNQKHINPYPHLVSSALLTHVPFDDGDYIISFSGCKIYSSQDVCNALFFNYFAISVPGYEQIDDPMLQKWLAKGAANYRWPGPWVG